MLHRIVCRSCARTFVAKSCPPEANGGATTATCPRRGCGYTQAAPERSAMYTVRAQLVCSPALQAIAVAIAS
jgi:hypothetical protein